jgi:hypothetical protein
MPLQQSESLIALRAEMTHWQKFAALAGGHIRLYCRKLRLPTYGHTNRSHV